MPSCHNLREMIADRVFTPLVPSGNTMKVELREAAQSDCRFDIKGLPENAVVIKGDAYYAVCLDRPGPVKPDTSNFSGTSFFKQGTHTGKRADYIVIDQENGILVLLEMKKSKDDAKSIKQQHVGAEAVLDYIRRVGACFFNQKYESFLGQGFKRHYVVVGFTDMRGRKRGRENYAGRSTLDDPLKISHVREMHYSKLKGLLVGE